MAQVTGYVCDVCRFYEFAQENGAQAAADKFGLHKVTVQNWVRTLEQS